VSTEGIIGIVRLTLETALWLAAPILIVGSIVSLLVSIGQVLTSIQDVTISTVPKLAAVGIASFILLPWTVRKLVEFTMSLFQDFHKYVG
jgi:flagellar biosynthetic protein FliQ